MPRTKHVFFSYAMDDKLFATALAQAMSDRGADVFLPHGDRMPGDRWASTLRGEIEKSSAVVFIIPDAGVAGRNTVLFEAGAAKALGKRVVAVLPPEGRLTEIPADMADLVVLDAGRAPLSSIADTLLQAVPEFSDAMAASG